MDLRKQYIIKINHWFDKINGNPYFSARIYDITMKLLKVVPFQYGNRSHAEDTVTAHIQANNPVHEIKNTVFQKCYMDHTSGLKRVATYKWASDSEALWG